jgi:hypothetical protein
MTAAATTPRAKYVLSSPTSHPPGTAAAPRPFGADAYIATDTRWGTIESPRCWPLEWPRRDVELARVLGDTCANGLWPQYRADLARASGAVAFGVAVGTAQGGTTLRIGVPLDHADNPVGREHLSFFDVPSDVKILPLTGISLPYGSGEVASCRIHARIQRLPAAYRDAVLAEAERVSHHVVEDDRQS